MNTALLNFKLFFSSLCMITLILTSPLWALSSDDEDFRETQATHRRAPITYPRALRPHPFLTVLIKVAPPRSLYLYLLLDLRNHHGHKIFIIGERSNGGASNKFLRAVHNLQETLI